MQDMQGICECYAERQMFCRMPHAREYSKGVWVESCVSMLGLAEMLQRYAVKNKGVGDFAECDEERHAEIEMSM